MLVAQQVIPADGHKSVTDKAVAPTCTEPGLTEGSHCTVCDKVLFVQEVVPAIGHNSIDTPSIAPGYDTVWGSEGGKHCGVCGAILVEPTPIKPTGPIVSAIIDVDGNLTISGGLSDIKDAVGTTVVAIYDNLGKMLDLKNITELDQSNLYVLIENINDAHNIKILRWQMQSLRPLHNAVEVSVKK